MSGMFRLDDKVAVVIGGGGSIGSAVALGLAEQGARVVIASRDMAKLEASANRIKSETGSEAAMLQVDVTDEQSIIQLADQVISRFGTVDILINAHGKNTKAPADKFAAEVWDDLFVLNVRGVMLACREFGKQMMKNGGGKIVNLSSVRGSRATLWGGNLGYCASKGAVDMLTRALAAEWAPYRINVNAVAPSLVAKPETWATRTPEQVNKYLANIPLKRVADPRETAGAFVFLASAAADFITGQIIFLDGGLSAVA
jgi:NAD(P)-dependent dehydrogenase (short-subunit alcohol dehydrogenase family)